MDGDSTDDTTSSGNFSDNDGSYPESDRPSANDNGNSVASGRSNYLPQTIAAAIVALAGFVYAILQVYGAVTDNGDKTQRLERIVSNVQTAIPTITKQLAAIPTEQPTFPPVIVKNGANSVPGSSPNITVTQLPGTPGKPGQPGQVKIIRVTQTPSPVPTCANSLLGVCVAK